jgi:1,4-alpha-glucan branching enzyme
VYRQHPALWELDNTSEGFGWLANDPGRNVVAFLRRSRSGETLACLVNFGGNPVGPYRVGLPFAGRWDEILNTDAAEFGGSGVGNYGGVDAVAEPWGDHPASVELTLPPLGAVWLKHVG